MDNDNITTQVVTFQEAIQVFGLDMPAYVRMDPALTKDTGAQFEVIRTCSHDGTLAFSYEVLSKALDAILGKTCFFAPDGDEGVVDRRYVVGMVTITKEFKEVDLPIGRRPGVRETVSIPVIAHQRLASQAIMGDEW